MTNLDRRSWKTGDLARPAGAFNAAFRRAAPRRCGSLDLAMRAYTPAAPEASSCRPAFARPAMRRSWCCWACRPARFPKRRDGGQPHCCRRSRFCVDAAQSNRESGRAATGATQLLGGFAAFWRRMISAFNCRIMRANSGLL